MSKASEAPFYEGIEFLTIKQGRNIMGENEPRCEPQRNVRAADIEQQPVEEISNNHNVGINKVTNGFIVTVGCKTLVFLSLDDLIIAMRLYYGNPEEAYKKYIK